MVTAQVYLIARIALENLRGNVSFFLPEDSVAARWHNFNVLRRARSSPAGQSYLVHCSKEIGQGCSVEASDAVSEILSSRVRIPRTFGLG